VLILAWLAFENTDIESGKYTEVLVGVSNDAAQGDLIVRTVEASFRYVQDMTQTIQNVPFFFWQAYLY